MGGGGCGCTLIFLYRRELRPYFEVKYFEFQYFFIFFGVGGGGVRKMNIFGVCRFCGCIFFGGGVITNLDQF